MDVSDYVKQRACNKLMIDDGWFEIYIAEYKKFILLEKLSKLPLHASENILHLRNIHMSHFEHYKDQMALIKQSSLQGKD